jgi:hypothetical protein
VPVLHIGRMVPKGYMQFNLLLFNEVACIMVDKCWPVILSDRIF